MTQTGKMPVWFWIAGIFALLWNAMGVLAYAGDIMMTAADFAKLTEQEQNLYANRPYWATAAFAVAVIAGFLGSVMLLLRRPIAVRLFLLSLLAVLVQFSSYFILDGYAEYISKDGWFMPISIPILAIMFFLFARWSEKNGLLGRSG
ncbi:hypothetical protein [Parasphingorhabdus cellanae]|uniref:Sugar transporter n=1 Tax=Parasphingorhabdus cellanae TaxID=2806553 RepID=A0ABX7T6K1_9SPHN|nr:hypothetical protein [Parasphingorhabdus cellanae]QTD56465.1 hypothetical protein J4G78_02370 [Parasphingorhabdus cellanae]